MTSDEIEKFEKVTYVPLEEKPLTWWEYFFGKSEAEIQADPQSKTAKYKVTEQIKKSVKSHKLIKLQSDTPFPHTQAVVKTDLPKMEDKSNELPSPYKPPTLVPKIPKKLHPSIQQLRKQRFKTAKDDLDI